MVGILNYGLGNVNAFQTIFARLGVNSSIVSKPDELLGVDKIILPGVGSFDWAMTQLVGSKMRDILDKRVLSDKIPVLGVCVGMQMMATSSEEGKLPGLGWFEGRVKRLDTTDRKLYPLPHMGWNDVEPVANSPLFNGLELPRFYFLHSYCILTSENQHSIASATYGNTFAAAIAKDNIFGVQFHPEKSHSWGVKMLENFSKL